jgi:hypothetical protein
MKFSQASLCWPPLRNTYSPQTHCFIRRFSGKVLCLCYRENKLSDCWLSGTSRKSQYLFRTANKTYDGNRSSSTATTNPMNSLDSVRSLPIWHGRFKGLESSDYISSALTNYLSPVRLPWLVGILNVFLFLPPPPPMVQQPTVGLDLLIVEASRSHSDTPQSVGILWTSDRPVAETSIRPYTTLLRDKCPCLRRDSNPQSQQPSGRRSTP